jgi:hypothetical protein
MADVTVSPQPGYYGGEQTVVVTFPPDVRKAIITQDDVAPVLSEVLAYDQGPLYPNAPPHTGVPPGDIVARPFMAVTQDGRGNVVYDAGFPKYYNGTMPSPRPTTFAMLTAAMKYLYNALNFIAKPNVTRKILFIGNTATGSPYDTKASLIAGNTYGAEGFRDTFELVAGLAGFTYDIRNVSDFGGLGKIDGTLTTFNQYSCVVVMCGANLAVGQTNITTQFSQELASYRAGGGGVMIITDHCDRIYTNLADAVANGSIFGGDATKVSQYYGTYFSGNVDRAPVLVSEIKSQLALNGGPGDHPLLNNMADTDSIYAGGSESLVMVETYASSQVDPLVTHSYFYDSAGVKRLNVLVQMEDGTVFVRPYRYDLIDPSDLMLRDARDRVTGPTLQTVKRGFDLHVFYNMASPPTMTGRVLRNGEPHGTFMLSNNVMTLKMCSGTDSTFNYLPTDRIGFAIEVPFIYTMETTIQALDVSMVNASWTRVAGLGTALLATPDYTGMGKKNAIKQLWEYSNLLYRDTSESTGNVYGIWPRVLTRIDRALKGIPGSCNLWIATNAADWAANKPVNPVEADTVIQADNNNVYTWWIKDGIGSWVTNTSKAAAFFYQGRKVVDKRGTGTWVIGANSTTLV